MLSFLNQYRGNVYSQNGEDMIIQECVRRLGINQGHVVEIGANDGLWLSNSRLLIEQGWSATLCECEQELFERCRENWLANPSVSSVFVRANADNINSLVGNCDVLSLDTDGQDFSLFRALTHKPKILIIEIDSGYPPSDLVATNTDGGVGYGPMMGLAISKGYFLVAHTGNLVLIDNAYREDFPEIVGDGITNASEYYDTSWPPHK